MGAVFGAGSVGASVLAGCGGGGQAGTAPGGSGGAGSGGPEIAPGEEIAAEGDVEPGSAVPYTDAGTGQPAVLVRLEDGEFVAYSAVCTHQGCTVAYRDGKLACPCHGGVFDPARGAAVVSGPPPRPLPPAKIRVKKGKVFGV